MKLRTWLGYDLTFGSCNNTPRCHGHCARADWCSRCCDVGLPGPGAAGAKVATSWALSKTQVRQRNAICLWCIAMAKVSTWWWRWPLLLMLLRWWWPLHCSAADFTTEDKTMVRRTPTMNIDESSKEPKRSRSRSHNSFPGCLTKY